jgi:hypothetical protein
MRPLMELKESLRIYQLKGEESDIYNSLMPILNYLCEKKDYVGALATLQARPETAMPF